MTPYGKVAHAAVSAISLLAEQYDPDGGARLNSRQIAEQRQLSQPIVGKVLTTLSHVGVVAGAPGPGGGYALSRPPREITLLDVVAPFDRLEDALACPFGDGWCGTGPQCPLHQQLESLRQQISQFLEQTTLEEFQHNRTTITDHKRPARTAMPQRAVRTTRTRRATTAGKRPRKN